MNAAALVVSFSLVCTACLAQWANCPLNCTTSSTIAVPGLCIRGTKAGERDDSARMPYNVAFFGDTGVSWRTDEIVRLCRQQNVSLIVHVGDMGYKEGGPDALRASLLRGWGIGNSTARGLPIPYLMVVGNHDVDRDWTTAETVRLARDLIEPFDRCTSYTAIAMACTFGNITFALVSPPLIGPVGDQFVDWAFSLFPSRWLVCVFHENQVCVPTRFQLVTLACIEAGADQRAAHRMV